MKTFLLNLQFIFKPIYWIMLDRYNKVLDERMNYLLDNFSFENLDRNTAELGGVTIWISNRTYSCMVPFELIDEGIRPSRLIIRKGLKRIKAIEKVNTTIKIVNVTK